MKNTKPTKHFKKPLNVNKIVFNSVKILFTAALVAILTMAIYYILHDGWQAFLDWWSGKWFCLIAVVLIVAVALGMWIWTLIKTIKKVTDNE